MRLRAALLSLVIACVPTAAMAGKVELHLKTAQRDFVVDAFRASTTTDQPAVLILSGSKGYWSDAYAHLAADLNAAGIDAYLIHYLADADVTKIERAGSASARAAYYRDHMADWIETIRATRIAISHQSGHRPKIGLVGISLGAMPVAIASANSSDISATTIVDGDFPKDFTTPVRSMPPLLLIWGEDDRVFPLATGSKLERQEHSLGGTAELVSFPGEGHGFFLAENNAHAVQAHRELIDFFLQRLK